MGGQLFCSKAPGRSAVSFSNGRVNRPCRRRIRGPSRLARRTRSRRSGPVSSCGTPSRERHGTDGLGWGGMEWWAGGAPPVLPKI